MIRPLRTYHYFTWRLLAVALPLVFVIAILRRPAMSHVPVKEFSKDFDASITSVNDSTAQINLTVLNPLSVPSCIVYAVAHTDTLLLGKLDERKEYQFMIVANHSDIVLGLRDPLHRKEIASFQLSLTPKK